MIFNQVIATENGKDFKGYLAKPQGVEKGPALILKHEVYGVTEGLKEMADQFAARGYLVLCPNMYWEHNPDASFKYEAAGQALTPALAADRDAARDLMFRFTNPRDGNLDAQNARLVSYVDKAADFLRGHRNCDGTVADSGLCFGGRGTYLSMVSGAKVDAGVAFYATPELHKVFSRAAAMKIQKPFMFIVGGEDPYITDAEKKAMRDVAGTTMTYIAGRDTPVREDNPQGNPSIVTLYYANSSHGWNRKNSKYSDPGTSAHTIDAVDGFLKAALGRKGATIPPAALATPASPTYHPQPKV